MQKSYSDPVLGEILFCKRKGTRRLAIKVHPVRGIRVSVPYLMPYAAAMAFFMLKREWVIRTVEKQRQHYGGIPVADAGQIEQMRARAKAELPARLKELADRYGFTYNKVTIKHNRTNWGSCSSKGNINLNLNIVRLPDPLRDYILLHELCHLRHHDHGEAFHLLLEHLCSDNLRILCDSSDPVALSLAEASARTGARYPLDRVHTRAIKRHPLM